MDIRNSLKFRDRKRPKAKQKFIATTRKSYSLRPVGGAEYCDQPVCVCVCVSVCLSASVSLEPLDRSARNFFVQIPCGCGSVLPGDVAPRYVLPVLWMPSPLAVMGATPKGGGCTQRRRSMCATGAESDVYEYLFESVISDFILFVCRYSWWQLQIGSTVVHRPLTV